MEKPNNKEINKVNCICGISEETKESIITCSFCGFSQHIKCIKDNSRMQNYVCFNCQFQFCDPFLTHIENLMKPSLIVHQPKFNQLKLSFKLNGKKIQNTKMTLIPNEHRNISIVVLRCIRLDNKGFDHMWPLNCEISLNSIDLKFSEIEYPPRAKRRTDHPIILFSNKDYFNFYSNNAEMKKNFYLIEKLNLNSENKFEIKVHYQLNKKDSYSYIVSIDHFLVETNNSNLIKTIKIHQNVSTLKSLLKLNEMFQSESFSLIDQYTGSSKIVLPARSTRCTHLQVFDLESYLLTNQKTKKFECPVCKTKATVLYIDGIIKNLMNENSDSFNLMIDSDFNLIKQIEKPKKEQEKEIECIDLCDDDIIVPKIKENAVFRQERESNLVSNKENEIKPVFRVFKDNSTQQRLVRTDIRNEESINNVNNNETKEKETQLCNVNYCNCLGNKAFEDLCERKKKEISRLQMEYVNYLYKSFNKK